MEKQRTTPFERVVAVHGPTVLKVCRAVLGPGAESEDAWSETFLAALAAWTALPAGANIEAWLVTIAHRKAIDITRVAARSAVPAGTLPDTRSTIGIPTEPDTALWAALAALPPKQRQCVAYHHVAGLPYRDIAALLGGTAEAARRAASDGISTLRTTLAPQQMGERP